MNASIKHVLVRSLQSVIGLVGLYALLIILLWNADVITLKQRYSEIQNTILGHIQATEKQAFAAKFKELDQLNFFKTSRNRSLNLNITTGVLFLTSDDLLEGKASQHWCYTQITQGGISQRIELGQQAGQEPPVFRTFDENSAQQIQALGINPVQLQQAAKTDCWFGKFQLTQHQRS